MKSSQTFCCIFPHLPVGRGNQHGEYDDLQNWLDMMSHENPPLKTSLDHFLTQGDFHY